MPKVLGCILAALRAAQHVKTWRLVTLKGMVGMRSAQTKTPAVTGVLTVMNTVWQRLAPLPEMEAAGIEPASCDPAVSASTCVVYRLISPRKGSTNKALAKPVHHLSRAGRSGH